VAHSFGGAVASAFLIRQRPGLRSLVLLEPTMPGVLRAHGEADVLAEIRAIYQRCSDLVTAGEGLAAAEAWVGYWSGEVFWRQLPAAIRQQTAGWLGSQTTKHFQEGADFEWDLEALRAVAGPTLVLCGDVSPRSARRTSELVAERLGAPLAILEGGVGHMSPLTHAPKLVAQLRAHLNGVPGPA
jgi:pimeloyl-ACP methyl ester carboxylesterase